MVRRWLEKWSEAKSKINESLSNDSNTRQVVSETQNLLREIEKCLLENRQALAGRVASQIADELIDLYSDLGDMPITVWIDQATGYPVRYYMDMTGVMQSMMSKALAGVEGGDSLTMDKVEITMDCSNFNNVADFEIPAEALAA